jgi:hypothetical protein
MNLVWKKEDWSNDSNQDLYLLVSLLVVALLHPFLDDGRWSRLILGVLTFAPLVIATIRTSQRKSLLWAFVVLISCALIASIAGFVTGSYLIQIVEWSLMTVAFALAVRGMFLYLWHATTVSAGHLYTAASVYLLLATEYYALYNVIALIHPHAFLTTTGPTQSKADLLYFSVATLTTLGYGDIVPNIGITRMLAGIEAATGVMYVAITVAILVSSYRSGDRS